MGVAQSKDRMTKNLAKISDNFSFLECLRGGLAEREDPGRNAKIFQNPYHMK